MTNLYDPQGVFASALQGNAGNAGPASPGYGVLQTQYQSPTGLLPDVAGSEGGGFDSGFWFGDEQRAGAIGQGVSALSGLAQTYLGMKQYGMAKKQFRQNRREFGLNYDANRQLTNSRLRDRQRARVASNPGAYQSVGDYMNQNEVAARA